MSLVALSQYSFNTVTRNFYIGIYRNNYVKTSVTNMR